MTDALKSRHAALLNRLSEMQQAPYYAIARATLAEAERVIVQLEATTTAQRGTDAQILKERELTVSAIEGAMAFGRANTNPPPSPDHWLSTWWSRGRQMAMAEEDSLRVITLADRASEGSVHVYVQTDRTGDPQAYRVAVKTLSEDDHTEYLADDVRSVLDRMTADQPVASAEKVLFVPDGQEAAQAFAIADEAMFEYLETYGVRGNGEEGRYGLADERFDEVSALAEACGPLREAFEWLRPRGYVELGTDDGGEFIRVLRDPRDAE